MDSGKTIHGGLDGEGDVFFNFLGGESVGHGEDLHEVWGYIGEGIDGKFFETMVAAEND